MYEFFFFKYERTLLQIKQYFFIDIDMRKAMSRYLQLLQCPSIEQNYMPLTNSLLFDVTLKYFFLSQNIIDL